MLEKCGNVGVTGSEVGYIAEHVEDCNDEQGCWSRLFECFYWILLLVNIGLQKSGEWNLP